MRKRNLLDSSVPEAPPKSVSATCGICERSPAFLCPTCPRRRPGERDTFDHGWARARENDPDRTAIAHRDAQMSRQLSITHESHPAYPEILADYQASGMALAALYERRRKEREAGNDRR